jgi:hypothetical protein
VSTGALSELSRRALAAEIERLEDGEALSAALVRPVLRLRESLLILVGTKGFRAVVERSLHLTAARYRWMAPLEIDDDGAIAEGQVAVALGQEGAAHVLEGMTALLGQLLDLLSVLIGEDVTLRLVRRAWSSLDAELPGRTGAGQ